MDPELKEARSKAPFPNHEQGLPRFICILLLESVKQWLEKALQRENDCRGSIQDKAPCCFSHPAGSLSRALLRELHAGLSRGALILALTQCIRNLQHFVPVSAITNYHKLGSLKQNKSVLLLLWRPEVKSGVTGLKSRLQQVGLVPSGGFGRIHSLASSSF